MIRHIAQLKTDLSFWALTVADDYSASLACATDNVVDFMVEIDASDDGSNIAICGEPKEWFDRELATGRARVKQEKNAVILAERVEMALADVPLDPDEIIEALQYVEIDPERLAARIKARLAQVKP